MIAAALSSLRLPAYPPAAARVRLAPEAKPSVALNAEPKPAETAQATLVDPKKLRDDLKTARRDARAAARNQALSTVQRLEEELKIIKKVWAENPKELARQLARVAKELARALKEYAAAARALGEAPRAAPAAAGATAAPAPSAAATSTETETKDGKPDPQAAAAAGAYAAQAKRAQAEAKASPSPEEIERREDDEAALGEARSDRELARRFKGLQKALRKEFDGAKIKAMLRPPGENDRTPPFEEAEKRFKALDKEIQEFEDEFVGDLDTQEALNRMAERAAGNES